MYQKAGLGRIKNPPSQRQLDGGSVNTVAGKIEVSNTLAQEIDETMLVFASVCDWVNSNTPEKMTNKTAMQSLVYPDVILNLVFNNRI